MDSQKVDDKNKGLDLSIFSKMFKEKMHVKNLSLREAAKEIGVSHTTVARLLSGEVMDLNTIAEVAKWMNVPLATILKPNVPEEDADLTKKILSVISTNPRLKKVFGDFMDGVLNGEMDTRVLSEIIAFAEFKIQYEKDNEQVKNKSLT